MHPIRETLLTIMAEQPERAWTTNELHFAGLNLLKGRFKFDITPGDSVPVAERWSYMLHLQSKGYIKEKEG